MQTFSMDDDYLSEIELDELLLQLSIGGDHSTHDHGDHDHGAHDHGDHDHGDHDHAHDDHDEHGHAHEEEDHAQHEHDHSDHDHHIHRRDLVRSLAHRLKKRAMSGVGDDGHDHAHGGHAHEDHAHGDNHDTETVPSNSKDVVTSLLGKQCYTAHQLFDIHGFNHSVGISRSKFPQICPSLIQQILSRACQFTVDHVDDGIAVATPEVWLYGMVSVLIISGCSIFSGLFLPCMSKNFYHNAVNTLVALAVAAMSGDALIHLLPMALGLHVHDHSGGHDHHHDHDHGPFSTEFVYVWKCTVAMGTVYVFFLFEMLVGFVTGHTHSHGVDQSGICDQQDQDLEKMGSPKSPRSQNTDNPDVRRNGHPSTDDVTKQNGAYDSGLSDDQIMAEERPSTPQFVAGEKRHVFEETKDIEQAKAHRRWICFSKGPLPVMVIIGDGLHNFGDGLAIGAAFLAGIGPGLSTSLAVFCHELPHELGDIAILLKSGISLKWALVLNFVSALTCVAGLVVGFIVGVTLEARQWIFAVTAGTFLYIALADMLPQLLRFRDSDNPKLMFCLINIGFLCGMAIIVVIALYEDAILVKL
ncbi:putative zinc transporter ZIP12 [Apostichopus japonicus]|uniref:Putative zinc transporter ZIP12 n=1 Tax=Stichopus japonicus TaxID=307972 RepID=A0A2G8KVL8_STIJA|nr:putative zinc transporter ZIP12 [Apostichopus japonicus]